MRQIPEAPRLIMDHGVLLAQASGTMKPFYIEPFGCQMNAHDSEKVIGTLIEQGYSQVPNADDAQLVLYNTCSIRDKAEQKVFNKLEHFKKARKGRRIA